MFRFESVALFLLLLSVCYAVGGYRPDQKCRQKEEPESNLVPSYRLIYPRSADEEPPCKTDHGMQGLCVDVRLCYAARRAVIAGNHPIRCGWIDGYVPKVCCHPDQVQRPKRSYRPYRAYRPYRFRYQRYY